MIALGAIKALTQKGFRVPEDISVVGFDNLPYSAITNLQSMHRQGVPPSLLPAAKIMDAEVAANIPNLPVTPLNEIVDGHIGSGI